RTRDRDALHFIRDRGRAGRVGPDPVPADDCGGAVACDADRVPTDHIPFTGVGAANHRVKAEVPDPRVVAKGGLVARWVNAEVAALDGRVVASNEDAEGAASVAHG